MDCKLTEQLLLKTLSISGMVAIAVSASLPFQVQALPNSAIAQQSIEVAQQRILYVNPQSGTDTAGAGQTEANAFRTITYALQQADAGTAIQLAPGEYSSQERFPLQLKPGVILKGNDSQQGQGVIISGGSDYISPTFASQNVTLITAGDTQIIGVTITNPNTRGTGIWVESSNPIIRNSTFVNNNREGIFVTGTATPQIENNRFSNNGGNGISVAMNAGGEIRGNVFENTGFGLAIGGNAAPLLADNQIRRNKTGVFITQSARPVLQGNSIENNDYYGVLAIAQAQPTLSSNNVLQGNQPGEQLIKNPGSVVIPSVPPTSSQATNGTTGNQVSISDVISFSCVQQGAGFATVAERGNASIPQPMITWNRDLGPDLTPQDRCTVVTNRLNTLVLNNESNPGSLENLVFTIGNANNSKVVCLINETQASGCTQETILFTLSPENAQNPREVLDRLLAFSVEGSGSPVQETAGVIYAPLDGLNELLQPVDNLWFVN